MDSDKQLNQVLKFVVQETACQQEKLNPETTLISLGLDGDDAADFIQKFSQDFSVDISGFEFSRYFGFEGLSPSFLVHWIVGFFKWIKYRSWERAVGKQPITINDLAEAAKDGKWLSATNLSSR